MSSCVPGDRPRSCRLYGLALFVAILVSPACAFDALSPPEASVGLDGATAGDGGASDLSATVAPDGSKEVDAVASDLVRWRDAAAQDDLAVTDAKDLASGAPKDLALSPDLTAAPDADVCGGVQPCIIDFPCWNRSVCAGGQTQIRACITTVYNGTPSPECSRICPIGQCCKCCVGGSCDIGALSACPPGTICREHQAGGGVPGVEANCLPVDGGGDLAGWSSPRDGGRTCQN